MLTPFQKPKAKPFSDGAVHMVENPDKGVDPKDVPAIIKRVIEEMGLTPYEINNGNCDEFADKVAEEIGGSVYTVSDDEDAPGHDWIFYKGKHYDAEAPNGVRSWKQLPIMKKHFQKEATHYRQISQNVPIIGRESFEEWFNESNRGERTSNRKRRLKQQQKAIKDNIKCTYDNPCETRKWEQERGKDSIGITGIEGKKFCLWCNNLYEPKQ